MATSADAPLIAHREEDDDGADYDDEPQHHDDGYANAPAQDEEGRVDVDQKVGLFMWLLAISAGISGLLFGCRCFSYLLQLGFPSRLGSWSSNFLL